MGCNQYNSFRFSTDLGFSWDMLDFICLVPSNFNWLLAGLLVTGALLVTIVVLNNLVIWEKYGARFVANTVGLDSICGGKAYLFG